MEAAEAALCANDQDLFWPMHDAIFYNQAGENEGGFARERLNRIAATVDGLDMDAWNSCMDDNTYEDQIEDTRAQGEQLGVQGTPSFIVDGQLLFGASYDELSQRIQEALGSS